MIFEFTPEEKQALYNLELKKGEYIEAWAKATSTYGKESEEAKTAKKAFTDQYKVLEQRFADLWDKMEQRRFSALKTPAEVLEDAKKQAQDAIIYIYARVKYNTLEDELKPGKCIIVNMASGGLYTYLGNWDYEELVKNQKQTEFNPEKAPFLLDAAGTLTYIERDILSRHIEALKDTPEADTLQDALEKIIESSPYTVTEAPAKAEIITADSALFKANMPMYHGKAIDNFILLDNKEMFIDKLADQAGLSTSSGDLTVAIQGFSNLKSNAGVNAHKLLCAGVAEFTQNNNYGGGKVNTRVLIPLEEYARKLNYPIDEKETDSPEAAKKEKKRAKEARKNARKRITNDLKLLHNLSYNWSETIKGKEESFISVHPFESVGIHNGYIIMQFGQTMAEYLKRLPVTQYPQGLLAIDARNPNAYNMGFKMAEHFSIDNNHIRGTANRLKVSTLLEVTTLPTYETLQNETPDDSRHWERRIKDPFETALDALTGTVIDNWEYVKAKGEPLTDKEAYSIADYETFSSLLVQFKLLEEPEHGERLSRRASEKKADAAKRAAKKKKDKKE